MRLLLSIRRRALVAAVALACLAFAGAARADINPVPANRLVTNSAVDALARSGNTLYIGGGFDRVGLATGPLVSTSASSGDVEPGALPVVTGGDAFIHALVSDGSGGWFIGGTFTRVGSVARTNLAHVLADGTVDTSFNPAPDDQVSTLVLSGSTLFVGGKFSHIDGQTRTGLAALDATTGSANSWAPNPDSDVTHMALSGSTLYVAGDFANIGATPSARAGLAAVSTSTGEETSWNPNPDGDVDALALSSNGSTVYVGGHFSNIGATPVARRSLAAINASDGNPTAWDPEPVQSPFPIITDVDAIVVAPGSGTVYVGGIYDTIGANSASRSGLAALDPTTGNATTWNPNPDNFVLGLWIHDSTVYVSGEFTHIGQSSQVARHGFAAIDVTSGDADSWDPDCDGGDAAVKDIGFAGSHVILAGAFDSFRGAHRNGLAAIDLSTGELLPWNPGATTFGFPGLVNALDVSGSTVYVGGAFDEIGQTVRRSRLNLAAVDASSGEATGWNPSPDDIVRHMAVNASTVYVAGGFTHIGANNASRAGLAALDPTTGDATSWDPNPDSVVTALGISNSTLYVGGEFGLLDGESRGHAGAFDADTGALSDWAPGLDSDPEAFIDDGSNVYMAGEFAHVDSEAHLGLARVDRTSAGIDTTWVPQVDANADAMALEDGVLYFSGSFAHVNGTARAKFAAVDTDTAQLQSFAPAFGGQRVEAIEAGLPGQLIVGGGMTSMDGAPTMGLALFGVPAPSGSGGGPGPGGGGGGAGGGGNPAPAPTPAAHKVKLSLKISRRQHVIRRRGLIVSATSDQAGTIVFSATVSVPKGAKVMRFKTVRKKVRAGKRVKVKLTLSKRNLALIKRALRHHHKLTAKVRVNARATAHPSSNRSVKVRLLR